MKYSLLISFLCLLQLAHAETTPFFKPSEFSQWHNPNKFTQILKDIPKDKYPVIIESANLVGDGVVFRVLVRPKPNKNFESRYIYYVNTNEFIRANDKFSQLGFILIHHQVIQLMLDKSHQATWVKNDLQ